MKPKPKLIAVVGPTASGKSDLAVEIARAVDGEVVSADSRQVYCGLDIGTGKITRREMRGVPHHLLDVVDPRRVYSVARYQREAHRAVRDILRRGKVPIICGGTGFYIQAVVNDLILPAVRPNAHLRKTLSKKSCAELFSILAKLDPKRANDIDAHNPVRLIRAIEIAQELGSVPELPVPLTPPYNALTIGILPSDTVLRERIHKRLLARMRRGMLAEARRLHAHGLSWRRMEELGLEYRFLARHLKREISKDEMLTKLETAIWHYAKRQKTWFKRDKQIVWLNSGSDAAKAIAAVEQFLTA